MNGEFDIGAQYMEVISFNYEGILHIFKKCSKSTVRWLIYLVSGFVYFGRVMPFSHLSNIFQLTEGHSLILCWKSHVGNI